MKTDRKFLSSRKAPFLASFTLAFALAAGNAGAGIPVTDVGNGAAHWTNSISTYISKIEQALEHGKTYTREFERVKDLATQVSSLTYALQGLSMTSLTARSPTYGMERCSPDGGLSLTAIFDLVAPNMNDSAPEQQRKICMQITRLGNEKYNENVRILKLLEGRTDEINRLQSQLGGSDTSGKVTTNMAQATAITSQLLADIQYSNAIVKVYESTIESLKEDQKYIAQEAFQGPKKGLAESLISTVAQTATMCGGLMVAKSDGSEFSCGL